MAADITHSNLNLTSEEKRLYGQLFQQADSEKLGVVTGDVAVKFFERTKLDPVVLGEIWQLADTENRGLLTPAGFSIVLRLIGHCQAGREPSAELAMRPGPLPKFDQTGISTPAPEPQAYQQPPTPAAIPQAIPPVAQAMQAQTTGSIRVPPLTADKVNEYSSLFDKAGARNGLLGGDAAKQMFEKARLPNELLGKVWNLADTEQRGALGMTEFVIAMHLLASLRTGALRALPQTLPAGLYEAAARRTPPAPVQAIPRQFTGQQAPRPQSPLSRPPFVPPPMSSQALPQQAMTMQPLSAQPTGADWLVSPQDKASFDKIFATIDRNNSGYIDGEQAVPFFSNSGLSEDILATIWDMSDINSEGRLSRDEFAVAMYLIRQQRGKAEDRGSMPTTLPPALIPPSMRKQQPAMASQSTAPAFDNAAFAIQQPKSASDDLFGLDALASSPEPAPQLQSIKPMAPAQSSPRTDTPSSSPRQPTNTSFKPFIPTSSFGQGLTSQNTGGSVQSSASSNRGLPVSQAPPPQPSRAPTTAADDLLGDSDPVISGRLTEETTELGNMSNQIGTLRNQMQEVQNKKISTGTELSATSNQKRELEARLAQFRTQYEQEVREVKSFEQQLSTIRNDTKRMQQELAMLEGTQADLQNQHQQVSTALEADQRENAALKERVRVMNETITQLKPQLEKLRSDARQQKGLVAINKKQVSTSEGDQEKITAEMNEVQRQIEEKNEQYRLERERVEQEHREAIEKLKSDRERNEMEHREISQKLKADRERNEKEYREATERLRADQEQFARQKAEFEQQRVKSAAADRERVESERLDRERAENSRSAMVHAPAQQNQSTVVSPAASVSSKNPFFKRSPDAQIDRTMSPTVFAEEYGGSSKGPDAFDNFFGPSKAATMTSPPPTSFRNDTHSSGSPQQFEDRDVNGSGDNFSSNSQHDEPPVSADHRQMNSANLPLRGLARSDSFSSSLRANPAASNFGVSGHASPLDQPGSPAEEEQAAYRQQEVPQGAADESAHSISSRVSPANNNTTYSPRSSYASAREAPGAFPGEQSTTSTGGSFANENRQDDRPIVVMDPTSTGRNGTRENETQRGDESSATTSEAPHGLFATIASFIPGTHADTASQPSSPEHYSALETIASYVPGTQANAEAKAAAEQHDGPEHHSALETIASYIPGTQANAEAKAAPEQYDSSGQQSSYGQRSEGPTTTEHGSTQQTGSRRDEFPPIRELEDDDSSDDDNTGFDDHFTPAHSNTNNENAPPTGTSSRAAGKQPALGESFGGGAVERDTAPPALTAQRSPPTYDQTVSPGGLTHDREANQFPPAFGGLLPSREIVSSPPADASPVEQQTPGPSVSQYGVSTTNSINNAGPSSQQQPSSQRFNQQSAIFNSTTMPIGHDAVVPQAQEPGDDEFDSAFDDLSEAREFDEPTQDSFSFSRGQSEEPDFSHDFNSHAAASRTTGNDLYDAPSSPLQTPLHQPDGFIKVKQFTSFGAAVPAPVTPYAPNISQQSPTASSFSSVQQPTASSSFGNSRQGPTFSNNAQPKPGPPSFSNYARYAEPTSSSSPQQSSSGFSSPSSSHFGAGAPQAQASRQVPPQASQKDDWDDLFSGLDNSNNVNSSGRANGSATTSTDPFAFDAFASTNSSSGFPQQQSAPSQTRQQYAPPPGALPPSQAQAQPQRQFAPPPTQKPQVQQQLYSPPPSRFTSPPPPPPPTTTAQQHSQQNRPQAPGRALSSGTEHDDPILKSLTSMGYKRDDALKALERFDYNIDAAVDHLSKN